MFVHVALYKVKLQIKQDLVNCDRMIRALIKLQYQTIIKTKQWLYF